MRPITPTVSTASAPLAGPDRRSLEGGRSRRHRRRYYRRCCLRTVPSPSRKARACPYLSSSRSQKGFNLELASVPTSGARYGKEGRVGRARRTFSYAPHEVQTWDGAREREHLRVREPLGGSRSASRSDRAGRKHRPPGRQGGYRLFQVLRPHGTLRLGCPRFLSLPFAEVSDGPRSTSIHPTDI